MYTNINVNKVLYKTLTTMNFNSKNMIFLFLPIYCGSRFILYFVQLNHHSFLRVGIRSYFILNLNNWQQKLQLIIRHQFRNHLTIIETNLEIKKNLVSKTFSDLVITTSNYFLFLKVDFYFMIFLVVYFKNTLMVIFN